MNPRGYLGKFYVDSLTHDPQALQFIIDLVGEDKVMLGTDYPFPLGEQNPGEVIHHLICNQSAKEKLLFENALEWLGIDKQYFLAKRK